LKKGWVGSRGIQKITDGCELGTTPVLTEGEKGPELKPLPPKLRKPNGPPNPRLKLVLEPDRPPNPWLKLVLIPGWLTVWPVPRETEAPPRPCWA
jgi:hypothetical protein